MSVAEATRRAGRTDPPTIIAVTKFHPAELVRSLASLGVREFGESRHQEAREKAADLADIDLEWHFVGQVQTKKARQIARYAHVIHSVDRPELLDALAKAERIPDQFLQINLTDDPDRGGAQPDDIEALAERAAASDAAPHIRGVMAVAPMGEDPRRAFEKVAEISSRVQQILPGATDISAGMSNDFPAAIEFGATHLRIGTAITGLRPSHR